MEYLTLSIHLFTWLISPLKGGSQDEAFRVQGGFTLTSPSAPCLSFTLYICKIRYEMKLMVSWPSFSLPPSNQLSFSATTPRRTHIRLLGLLSIILTIAAFCLLICVVVGCHSGINTFAFMVAEVRAKITLKVFQIFCNFWENKVQ